MGLLDDAIREHLELKRRRGADPGEVALQERAALDPAYPEEGRASAEEHAPDLEHGDYEEAEPAYAEAVPAAEDAPHLDPAAPLEHPAGYGEPLASTGEETAEFDMEAILEADVHEGHQGDALGHEAIDPRDVAPAEEPIEWETPTPPGEQQELPEQIPGQERLTFE